MGNKVGMGMKMGKIEIDDRGRITLPVEIREKLFLKSGEKLTINVNSDNTITIKKKPSKELIFDKLVGCIKTALDDEKPTPESIKGIWKMNQ